MWNESRVRVHISASLSGCKSTQHEINDFHLFIYLFVSVDNTQRPTVNKIRFYMANVQRRKKKENTPNI